MNKNKIFLIRMLLSSLFRRRARLAVALLGIAIGGAVLLGMVTLCYDVPRQMSQEFRSYGANMVIVPAGGASLASLADIDAVAALLPPDKLVGVTPYRYVPVRSNMLPYTAVGVRFEQARKTSPYWQVQGQWPQADNEILIGADIAEATRLQPGASIPLDGRNEAQARFEGKVIVTGIVKTGGAEDGFIFMDINALHRLMRSPDPTARADLAEVSVAAGAKELDALMAAVHAARPALEARPVKRVTQSEATVLTKLEALVYLVTLVVLLLTMICVATTMMTVVLERRKEIGLKKALGAENRSIAGEFLAEGLLLGVLGGFVGAMCGLVFAQIISATVFDRSITVEFYLIPLTVAISTVVTVLACLIPVRLAIDVEPALVLRGE